MELRNEFSLSVKTRYKCFLGKVMGSPHIGNLPDNYLNSGGMKPEIVAEHEEKAEYEGEIVQGEGRQDVP